MRYLTILFLVITFLWWVLLLVSIFVSPPGLHTRGSGFFDFAYTCLTLGNLLVATIFFVTPARGLRITTAIIAGLLAIDMILILAVPRIRLEEGWVGIASVVWAFVMAVWCILTDRVVAYGKHEEEERLTGRAETRRTLKEWLAVTVATILTVIFIVIVILMTGTLGMRARDATLKMYGDRILVDGDKYAVHLACVGNASETSGSKDPHTHNMATRPEPAVDGTEKQAHLHEQMSIGNDANGALGNRVSFEGVNTSMSHGSHGVDSFGNKTLVEGVKSALGLATDHPYGDLK